MAIAYRVLLLISIVFSLTLTLFTVINNDYTQSVKFEICAFMLLLAECIIFLTTVFTFRGNHVLYLYALREFAGASLICAASTIIFIVISAFTSSISFSSKNTQFPFWAIFAFMKLWACSMLAIWCNTATREHQMIGQPPNASSVRMVVLTDHIVNDSESEKCPICLTDFEVGETVQKTTCDHLFHTRCIGPWVELHTTCPVCRATIVTEQ